MNTKSKLLKSIFISLILVMGINNAWGSDPHFYLNGKTTKIENYYGQDSKYSIYVWMTTNSTFYLNNGSDNYGPNSNNTVINANTTGASGGYNSNKWKYTGATGLVRICIDQASSEWYPSIWVEEMGSILTGNDIMFYYGDTWSWGTKYLNKTNTNDYKNGNAGWQLSSTYCTVVRAAAGQKYWISNSNSWEGVQMSNNAAAGALYSLTNNNGNKINVTSGKIPEFSTTAYAITVGTATSGISATVNNTSSAGRANTLYYYYSTDGGNSWIGFDVNDVDELTEGEYQIAAIACDGFICVKSSNTATLTINTKTYSYTVTAGEGGTVSPASGTVAQGSGVTITATPDDGYEFNKWTATNGTLANANSASTTFTPSANNANATASFKVAGCTQTPTTPTSLTAKVGGNALAGEICSGTSVTLTAGGTISVGSLQWGTGTVGENIIDAGNGRSSITVSPTVTTTYWVRSIITEAGVCEGVTSDAKTLQVSITPALVQPVLSKSALTLEEGGSTGSITVTSGTTGGTWTSSDQNVATVNNGTVTSVGPGTATITYTVSNGCEEDKTATCTVTVNAKPYYIGGRFQQKWNDGSSTTNPFTYAGNGRYKLETGKTVAELSAQITESYGNRDQFFFIHTGKGKAGTSTYPFWTTKNGDNSGHNFEAHIGESNAIELGRQETNWNSIDENRLIKFTDGTDKSSDVVIWWEPSTNKLWYTAQKNYKITYGIGNNKGTDAVTTSPSITSGELIDPSTSITFSKGTTKAGYTWKNWNNKADGTGTNLGEGDTYVSSNRTGDISVYACYDLITYNITYNLNGGTGATNTTYNVTSNDITLPTTPTKTGYTFVGWYDNEGCTGEPIATITQGSTGNKTFYAKWLANKYTVKFHENGGKGEMADQGYIYDAEQALTGNAFTLENALFVGWATSEENAKNGEVAYTNGQSVSNLTTTKDGVVNLYAVWATIEITKHDEYISPNDHLKLSFTYSNIPNGYYYRVKVNTGYYQNSSQVEWITISGSGTEEFTSHVINLPQQANTVLIELCDGNKRKILESNSVIVTAERFWEVAVYKKVNNIETHICNISPTEHIGVEITAENIAGYQFTGWSANTPHITIDNQYSTTTIIKAAAGGIVYANYKELELKTIYLKTIEDTKDGDKWFVVYGGQEHEMTPLGCTGEYYRGVVPEGTSFHFVSKDNNDTPVETKGSDLQYVEGKTLYNLVSLAASGNKIFFKPNQQWIDKASKDKLHFAGRFWTGSAVWKEMTDDNGDGIYDCEKPTNGNEVIFCSVNNTDNIENWGDNWSYKQIQTNGDNAYKQIPNGSNLFTITDNKEDQAIGTWSTHADTPVNGDGEWTTFTGITYRITFNQQEATTAGTTHVDVAYHASMPEIEKLPTKTEKKFGGYYTQPLGQGVMLVNAFGEWQDTNGYISSTTWEREGCVTLHAYWKDIEPEITDITLSTDIFEPVDENEEGFVTATPTINTHNNDDPFVVCWKLLYSNGREVEGTQYEATLVEGNIVKFSIAGLSTGTYTIRASLHTGNACGSGEEISRFDKQFSIVANRIITINYTCDGNTIMASTKQNAHVINETEITAPDIVGYTFKEWVAGDGVIISTADKTQETIEFTAYYDGNLTATYTKNQNIIYFYNTLGWQNVYVYFYSGFKIDGNEVGYWNNEKGTGSHPKTSDNDWYGGSYKGYAQMTQITGSNIWYVNASGKNTTYLVFGKDEQPNYEFFYSTEVVRRNDYNKTLPMYVPIKAAPEYKNYNGSDKTTYYNKGYWMNYPENTGYKLQIYDGTGDGAKEVASVRFPYSTNTIMPLTVSVDLEAGKTYGFKILREDNTYFSNSGTMSANSNGWSFTYGVSQNCGLKTTLAGDYTFTIKYTTPDKNDPNKYEYCVDVVYPVSVGDYRVVYTDNANWSQTTAHDAKWYHPSYAIKKNNSATEEKTDIVSFFIAKNNSPAMKFQKCTAINGQTVTWADVENGAITPPKDKTETSVYNFIVKQPAGGASISVESVEPYTGNYYIRVDAMDGKWGNYKTNPDNRMTYSAFSESEANKFGEKFSHYATKWCEEGTNVKFTIANDYSPCISDTLIQDNGDPFNNIDIHGNLTSNSGKHAANIRFMWNRHTNKISRAYVAGSTFTDRQFLILKANKEIKNSSGGSLSNAGDNHNAHQAIFSDTQNWIYERTIQVQPGTRVKLYACYPEANVANAQYFRGTYDNNNATWNDDNSVQILGGTGASWNTIRIIYDFKTNRLMAAWVPTGEINDKSLEADMMILREHQEDAACITFADSDDKLINIKTVYGVLRLNKYILNNKKTTGNHEILDPKDQKSIYERALYFISFPFDVHLSDVFGFGTYGTHWVISEYNGLRRAKNGYFVDNCMNEDCTNWDYIWDPSNFTMKANQGYLLSLDLDLMKDNNESFWAHGINTVELYFPSYEHVQTIQQTSYTMPALGTDYICTHKGHEVIDSYWRCIGVPSFADYNSALTDGENDIRWQPKGSEFPFLYEWNVSDNSLMVQATSTYRFRPTYAYLVQNGREIHWSAVNATPNQPSNIVARRQAPGEINNYEWKLTLSRNEQIEDQAFVRLSDDEQVTTEFDFNQDLSKEFNYGRSDIYTLIGNTKAAANSLPFSEQTTLIPLGLSIEYNGDYTIAMPGRMENIGVTLIDTESNTRTNLSAGMEYTLTLNKGDYNNRFFIEISPIQQTPTDIEYVTGDSNSQDSVRKVLIDNILYIVRDGQIFDARGARVK